METTINIEDKILHGKNAQSIRKILKERTPKSFEIKNKGKKVLIVGDSHSKDLFNFDNNKSLFSRLSVSKNL